MKTFLITLASLFVCLSMRGGDMVEMSLITCHPGPVIYELEGHSGLRVVVRDSVSGKMLDDIVYDWGNFDFDAPNFVYRFVKGETDYSIGAKPTDHFVRYYAMQGRRVVEQKLNLTEAEKMRILALLYENLLPENRVYRYNYVKDNCSTRIVTLIEKATGTEPVFSDSGLDADTFREAMRRYHANYPWYQFGIDLALGSPLDKKVDDRAMMFSPEALERMMAGARRADGEPLVGQTADLTYPSRPSAVEGPTPFWKSPMAVALLILVIASGLTIRDCRRRRITRWFDSLLFGIFGIEGLILTFLIFISVHEATSPNYLYLWLNPLCFIVTAGIWVKKAKKLLYCYQIVNFVLLLALCAVFASGLQVANAAFYPLIAADAMRSLSYIRNYRCQH